MTTTPPAAPSPDRGLLFLCAGLGLLTAALAAVAGIAVVQRNAALVGEARARDAAVISGARELLARDQPGPAILLLLEVKEPAALAG